MPDVIDRRRPLVAPWPLPRRLSARSLVEAGTLDRYATLDDIEPLALATKQPDVFVERLEGRVVIDEVQRAPELRRALERGSRRVVRL